MKNIGVLDVTLRDGGCVNNFNFGQEYMDHILSSLETSKVDYIELGYIDEEKGTASGRTQFCNEKVISEFFLKHKVPKCQYVAMIDLNKFDVENLEERKSDGIDGIRIAFHKKDWKEAIKIGRKIINKGYKLFIQPMTTLRYSDKELLELIEMVNSTLPDAFCFYIVDSFGEMRSNDVKRIVYLVDHNLNKNIAMGFHSHNNLQLSYSNAMSLLEYKTERFVMIDSSVMGMGKGAGNLNTELLLEHLNLYYNKKYIIAPLLDLIDQVINVIHKENYWGYSVEYYLSSINHCTPSYAGYFYNKHMLQINQVSDLLGMIDEEKKVSFDKEYAENLYLKYNSTKACDDSKTIDKLNAVFQGKKVLIIAPGKSIEGAKNIIKELLNEKKLVSISLNNLDFETDYVLTTRVEIFEEAKNKGRKIIAPSNVTREATDLIDVIDYEKWIIRANETYDSSGVMALLLVEQSKAKEVLLAGFDGFSSNINENYYDITLRKPVTEQQAECRNLFYNKLISKIGKNCKITFLTESKYK